MVLSNHHYKTIFLNQKFLSKNPLLNISNPSIYLIEKRKCVELLNHNSYYLFQLVLSRTHFHSISGFKYLN